MQKLNFKTQYVYGALRDTPYWYNIYLPFNSIEQVKKDIRDVSIHFSQECLKGKEPNLIRNERYYVIYKVVPIQIIDTKEEWCDYYNNLTQKKE